MNTEDILAEVQEVHKDLRSALSYQYRGNHEAAHLKRATARARVRNLERALENQIIHEKAEFKANADAFNKALAEDIERHRKHTESW